MQWLKIVRTLLNHRVLGTSSATVFLSNDHSLYAPIYLGWTSCLILFACNQSACQERVESDKIQNEKYLPTVGLEPTTLRFQFLCSTDLPGLLNAVRLNCLIKYMYSQYQCIPFYKYENDEVERIVLFCVTYWNISILIIKRRISPVLAFNMQIQIR